MYVIKVKRIIAILLMLGTAGLSLTANAAVIPADGITPPELPALCSTLEPQVGTEAAFHAYAIGVQIYRWNGAAWVFVAPSANLYADRGYHGKVGTHYAGPIWESNSGSNVIARKSGECTPDAAAIPWLLLDATLTEGPGVFRGVTQIQRVNTTGGSAPALPGSFVGQESRVSYTAEYYFYKAAN